MAVGLSERSPSQEFGTEAASSSSEMSAKAKRDTFVASGTYDGVSSPRIEDLSSMPLLRLVKFDNLYESSRRIIPGECTCEKASRGRSSRVDSEGGTNNGWYPDRNGHVGRYMRTSSSSSSYWDNHGEIDRSEDISTDTCRNTRSDFHFSYPSHQTENEFNANNPSCSSRLQKQHSYRYDSQNRTSTSSGLKSSPSYSATKSFVTTINTVKDQQAENSSCGSPVKVSQQLSTREKERIKTYANHKRRFFPESSVDLPASSYFCPKCSKKRESAKYRPEQDALPRVFVESAFLNVLPTVDIFMNSSKLRPYNLIFNRIHLHIDLLNKLPRFSLPLNDTAILQYVCEDISLLPRFCGLEIPFRLLTHDFWFLAMYTYLSDLPPWASPPIKLLRIYRYQSFTQCYDIEAQHTECLVFHNLRTVIKDFSDTLISIELTYGEDFSVLHPLCYFRTFCLFLKEYNFKLSSINFRADTEDSNTGEFTDSTFSDDSSEDIDDVDGLFRVREEIDQVYDNKDNHYALTRRMTSMIRKLHSQQETNQYDAFNADAEGLSRTSEAEKTTENREQNKETPEETSSACKSGTISNTDSYETQNTPEGTSFRKERKTGSDASNRSIQHNSKPYNLISVKFKKIDRTRRAGGREREGGARLFSDEQVPVFA